MIPVVDISGLRCHDLDDRRAVAAELNRACEEVGARWAGEHLLMKFRESMGTAPG